MRSHGGARAKPAFYWAARGDWSNLEPDSKGVIFSNCDHLKLYIGDRIIEADPDRTTIPGLAHPPFQVELRRLPWTDLRIEGYVNGNKVIEKQYSSKGIDQEFVLLPDDTMLIADGTDTTRVVFRVTDEYGSLHRYSTAAIVFDFKDRPISLVTILPVSWVVAAPSGCARKMRLALYALKQSIQHSERRRSKFESSLLSRSGVELFLKSRTCSSITCGLRSKESENALSFCCGYELS